MIFIFYLKPVLWKNLHIINFIYPIRGRMPPKNTKKQKEDTAEMDVEIIDSLLPFEKLMAEKTDKLHGTLEEISKNVSKLTKHLLKSSGSDNSENTSAKEGLSATNSTSSDILKQISGTLKEILNAKSDAIINSQ